MRRVAVLTLAAAACASAPAKPAPEKDRRPTAKAAENDQPARLPAVAARETAVRIVEAQSTKASGVTDAFTVVEVNLYSADQLVREALAVLDAMAAEIDRRNHEEANRFVPDPLDRLVDHVNDLLDHRLKTAPCSLIFAVETTAGPWRRLPGFVAPKARLDPPLREHRLSWRTIWCGGESVRDQVAGCYARYKVPGKAFVAVVVGKDGTVTSAAAIRPFANTPTGDCVAAAAKTVMFPQSDSGGSGPSAFVLK